jgi:hypothetical protein
VSSLAGVAKWGNGSKRSGGVEANSTAAKSDPMCCWRWKDAGEGQGAGEGGIANMAGEGGRPFREPEMQVVPQTIRPEIRPNVLLETERCQ